MSSAVERIRRAFTKRYKDTRVKTRWLNAETARRAVAAAGDYNFFDADETADAIRRIAAKDPNARFVFGREGSPVLYVETRKPGVAIGVLGSMPGMTRPDELGKVTRTENRSKFPKTRPGHSVVRAWWD